MQIKVDGERCFILLETLEEKCAVGAMGISPKLQNRFKDGLVTEVGPFETSQQAVTEMSQIQDYLIESRVQFANTIRSLGFYTTWGW